MNKIKAVIIDDSPQARKLLSLMLADYRNDIEVVAEAENAIQGLECIKKEKAQIVFLDIEMPGKSGIQLAEQLLSEKINVVVIFTTAYNEYALKAFRLSAIDYLLKPINENHLEEAIQKVKQIIPQKEEQKLATFISNYENVSPKILSIPSINGYIFTKIDDVLYIKADGSYTHIFTSNEKTITISKNLKYFESTLEGCQQFIRVHRSYLINLQKIKKFDKQNRGTIVMIDDNVINLARDRREAFFEALDRCMI
jgi:two-component system LytT family response regulator